MAWDLADLSSYSAQPGPEISTSVLPGPSESVLDSPEVEKTDDTNSIYSPFFAQTPGLVGRVRQEEPDFLDLMAPIDGSQPQKGIDLDSLLRGHSIIDEASYFTNNFASQPQSAARPFLADSLNPDKVMESFPSATHLLGSEAVPEQGLSELEKLSRTPESPIGNPPQVAPERPGVGSDAITAPAEVNAAARPMSPLELARKSVELYENQLAGKLPGLDDPSFQRQLASAFQGAYRQDFDPQDLTMCEGMRNLAREMNSENKLKDRFAVVQGDFLGASLTIRERRGTDANGVHQFEDLSKPIVIDRFAEHTELGARLADQIGHDKGFPRDKIDGIREAIQKDLALASTPEEASLRVRAHAHAINARLEGEDSVTTTQDGLSLYFSGNDESGRRSGHLFIGWHNHRESSTMEDLHQRLRTH